MPRCNEPGLRMGDTTAHVVWVLRSIYIKFIFSIWSLWFIVRECSGVAHIFDFTFLFFRLSLSEVVFPQLSVGFWNIFPTFCGKDQKFVWLKQEQVVHTYTTCLSQQECLWHFLLFTAPPPSSEVKVPPMERPSVKALSPLSTCFLRLWSHIKTKKWAEVEESR